MLCSTIREIIVRSAKKYSTRDAIRYKKNRNEIEVKSIAYNEGKNEYIVIDNYIDVLYLNPTKNYLMSDLKALTHSNKVVVYLYPEENCTFIGDCAQCNEYVENLEKETNIDNQFDVSVKLNLTKELTNNSKDYINNHNYKFIIEITFVICFCIYFLSINV